MAKAKKKSKSQTQAARLLEAVKAARETEKGFQRDMGKATLARNARKPTRIG